jgi:hypothetical protein
MSSEKIKEYFLQIAGNANRETQLDDIYEQLVLFNDIDESEEDEKKRAYGHASGSYFSLWPMVKVRTGNKIHQAGKRGSYASIVLDKVIKLNQPLCFHNNLN